MNIERYVLLLFVIFFSSCNSGPQRDENGEILKNGQFYDKEQDETGEVWICTGKSSHAYHSSIKCYGLRSCRSNKKKVDKQIAIDMGRTPCHYCYKDIE